MDSNDDEIKKVNRLIYSKEVLNSLRNSPLSLLWPHSLDKSYVNSQGQWDPVKSFDSTKPTETKRGNLYESKTYRNNDKNKDDISLRPERRKWNDGCQVSNNKRNNDDIHSNSYRKSYQGATLTSGDYDRRSFSRNTNRSVKLRDIDKDTKYHGLKTEKSSRNNSNLDERKEEKDEHISTYKICNNAENEPEWFSNGPDNCDEIIELRGITASDTSIVNFKKDTSKNDITYEHLNGASNEIDKRTLNFNQDSPSFIETCITSPKREGSRFQDIFQKETKNNHLRDSKDVENIIKAVLSDTVSKSDAEKLNNVTKPLPNGVLTVEEIEKNMSSPMEINQAATKSATIETLTFFEPSVSSLFSSAVSNTSIDNSKVVNWLSNLNMNIKESENEHKGFCPDAHSLNNIASSQSMFTSTGYSKFVPNLQHPPGLPLMLNSTHLQQHQSLQQQYPFLQQHQHPLIQQHQHPSLQQHQHPSLQQQQHPSLQQQQNPSLQQHSSLQQQQQHPSLQQQQQQLYLNQQQMAIQQSLQNEKQMAYMKQLNVGQSNNINIPQRNPLLRNLQQHEGFIAEKYNLKSQQILPNDLHLDQSILSNFIKTNMQINHITDRSNMVVSGPPGLVNMNMSRPIVKTNSSFGDFAQVSDLIQNNYRRPISSNPIYPEVNKPSAQFNSSEIYNMRSRDNVAIQQNMLLNNYQQPPSHYENVMQRSSSNKMLANLFNVNSSSLPPLPQQAKYADQIETENII